MADDWGSTSGAGDKKRNPWLWGCGLGCLGLLVMGGVVGYMGFSWFRSALDPDVAFQNMTEHLPAEQLPAGWKIILGSSIPGTGMEVTVIHQAQGGDGSPMVAMVFVSEDQEQGETHWNETMSGGGSPRSVEVQGRVLMGHSHEHHSGGSTFLVMVSEEDEPSMIMIQFQRSGSSVAISDEDIQAFFNPFTIGPDGPYTLPVPDYFSSDGSRDSPLFESEPEEIPEYPADTSADDDQ